LFKPYYSAEGKEIERNVGKVFSSLTESLSELEGKLYCL